MKSIFARLTQLFTARDENERNMTRSSLSFKLLLLVLVLTQAVDFAQGFSQGRAEACCKLGQNEKK